MRLLAAIALLALSGCSAGCDLVGDAEARPGRDRRKQWVSSSAADGGVGDSGVPPDSGFSNLALLVDGVDERMTVTDNAALTCTLQMTVSVWVRASAQVSTDLICGKTAGSTQKEWALQQDSATDEYRIVLGTSTSNHCDTTTANAAVGTYQHVCVQYDGVQSTNAARARVWVNGSEQTLSCGGTIPSVLVDSSANLTCGSTANGAQFFNGYVDEFFYRCALVSCVTLYNSGVPTDVSGLSPLGWWRMGEGSTHPAIINAANPGTYDGTLTNGEAGDIQAVVP